VHSCARAAQLCPGMLGAHKQYSLKAQMYLFLQDAVIKECMPYGTTCICMTAQLQHNYATWYADTFIPLMHLLQVLQIRSKECSLPGIARIRPEPARRVCKHTSSV
jgi:hypothetical protein